MGPSPPNATRALLASPHIGIVALSPPEEQLRDSIIATPHTQDRSSCLACHNLHTGPPDSRCSPCDSALTWSPTPAQRAASPASSIASFRDSSSIDLDSDSGSDSSSSSGSNSSDSVVTAVPRRRTLSRRDTTSAPSPARSQSSPAPSWGDPVFDRDQIQGPFYTTEVLFDKVGALGRTTDNILVQVDDLGGQLHRQLEDVERQGKENKEHLEERLVEVERAAALRHEEVIQMMSLWEGKIITLLYQVLEKVKTETTTSSPVTPEQRKFSEFFPREYDGQSPMELDSEDKTPLGRKMKKERYDARLAKASMATPTPTPATRSREVPKVDLRTPSPPRSAPAPFTSVSPPAGTDSPAPPANTIPSPTTSVFRSLIAASKPYADLLGLVTMAMSAAAISAMGIVGSRQPGRGLGKSSPQLLCATVGCCDKDDRQAASPKRNAEP
ncbi:hypothetical protein EV426DRAFT_682046 [Tirmania nivea]|nr:hypothetical protein EV426DRAFT_682046 [Tirmania nivea]